MTLKKWRLEEIARAALIVLVSGIQIYVVLDRLSDGELSEHLSLWFAYKRYDLQEKLRVEREVSENKGAVLFEAISIIEKGE